MADPRPMTVVEKLQAGWSPESLTEAEREAVEKYKAFGGKAVQAGSPESQVRDPNLPPAGNDPEAAIREERMKDPAYAIADMGKNLALAGPTMGMSLMKPAAAAAGELGSMAMNSSVGQAAMAASPLGAFAGMVAGSGAQGEGLSPQAGVTPVGAQFGLRPIDAPQAGGSGGAGASVGSSTATKGSPYSGALGRAGRSELAAGAEMNKKAGEAGVVAEGATEVALAQSTAAQQNIAGLQQQQAEAMAEALGKIEGSAAGMARIEQERKRLGREYNQKLEYANLLSTYGGAPIALVQQYDAQTKQANSRLQEISGALGGRALSMEDAQAKPEQLIQEQQAIQQQMQRQKSDMDKYTTTNPARWATENSGKYFMAALGAAFADIGGILAGAGPQGDAVMEGLYRTIDADIAAQKQQFKSRQEDVGVITNNYELAAQMSQDDFTREQAAGAFAINAHREQLAGFQQMAQTEEHKATLARLDADMMQKMQQKLIAAGQGHVANGIRGLSAASESSMEAQKLSIMENKAAGGPTAKRVPAGEATEIADIRGVATATDTLEQAYQSKHSGASYLPGSSQIPGNTKSYDKGDRATYVANVTKALFGGKASDADREFIDEIVPYASTTPEMANNQFKAIKTFSRLRAEGRIQALGETGYDVSGLGRVDKEGLKRLLGVKDTE